MEIILSGGNDLDMNGYEAKYMSQKNPTQKPALYHSRIVGLD